MPRDRYDDDDDRRRRDDDYDGRRRRRYDDDDFDRPPPKSGSGLKVVFIVLGIVGVVGVPLVVILFFAVSMVRAASARLQVSNNLKQSALAAYNYESRYQTFPRPYLDADDKGAPITPPAEPSARLSWRVALLPYLGEPECDAAYRRFNLREAWDGPTNAPLRHTPIKAYRHPMDIQGGGEPVTRIRCFYDNGALFDTKARVTLTAVTDGAANTIMFVESADTVPWPQFNDWKYDPAGPLPAFGHPNVRQVFQVVMADGSVRPVRSDISPQAVKAAITRAGGEISSLD